MSFFISLFFVKWEVKKKKGNTNSGNKHGKPTHFSNKLDVFYAKQHTCSKVTVSVANSFIGPKFSLRKQPTFREVAT